MGTIVACPRREDLSGPLANGSSSMFPFFPSSSSPRFSIVGAQIRVVIVKT